MSTSTHSQKVSSLLTALRKVKKDIARAVVHVDRYTFSESQLATQSAISSQYGAMLRGLLCMLMSTHSQKPIYSTSTETK